MRVRSPSPLLLLGGLVLAGLSALPARGDLDVTLRNGDIVRGTLEPATEVETFHIDLPRGARLKVVAKGRKTSARPRPPVVRLRLTDRYGVTVPGDVARNGRSSAKISGYDVPASASYAVEVRGDGFALGDYSLSVRWKTPRKYRWRDRDTSQGFQNLDFGADAGAAVVFTAKAAKGSVAKPVVTQLVRLDGATEIPVKTYTFPLDPGPVFVGEATIRDTGDHRLKLRDGGGASAGSTAVTVPPDAVERLTPVQLALGAPFDGPPASGLLPIGDGVFVGPERLEFGRLVNVVLPFDLAKLPEGTGALRVVRRESTGLFTVLDAGALVIDAAGGRVTAPVPGGGSYGAFRLVPPPKPTSVTPFGGAVAGGYTITLGGSDFRDARDEHGDRWLAVTLDGEVVNVTVTSVSPTLVAFTAPSHVYGKVTWGVLDRETGVQGQLPSESFEYR